MILVIIIIKVISIRTKPSFESPYATSNVIYDPERKIKVHFTPLPRLNLIHFTIPSLMVKSPRTIYYSLSA